MSVLMNNLNDEGRWREWTTSYGYVMMPEYKAKKTERDEKRRLKNIDELFKLKDMVSAYKRMLRFPGKYKSVEDAVKAIDIAYYKSYDTRNATAKAKRKMA
jgi:hypothetical protein